MTVAELVQAQFPESTSEFWADYGRTLRNNMLTASDWTQAHDDPTGNRDAWAVYRQTLRDLPSDPAWPNVNLPDPPA